MTAQDSICRQLLNKPGLLSNQGTISAIFGSEAFIAIDDRAKHNAPLRNVWIGAFKRESVAAMLPWMRQAVDRLLDAVEQPLRGGQVVDISGALCAPLPPLVDAAHMLGIADDMLGPILKVE